MKKTLLFLLLSTIVSAQNYIELRLVSADVGAGIWDGSMGQNVHSTDAGLDAILQNYGTTAYIGKWGHPLASYNGRIMSVNFTGNTELFLAELNAYSTVVEQAKTGNFNYFDDAVYTQITDAQIGIPVGFENDIVVTNDEGLNAIFATYNVYFYEQWVPNAITENLLRWYVAVCHCDNEALKTALDNYTVSANTNYVPAAYLLDKKQFNATQASVYPNPFSDTFQIDTKQKIKRYTMFDGTGKQLISADSKAALDKNTSQLSSGIYILELQTENGQTIHQKLIKR